MGKLNFRDCNIKYNESLIKLEIKDNIIIINYDFTNTKREYSIIRFIINTSFIKNQLFKFESKDEITLKLDLRKGEQNFIYSSITFNIIDNIIIPLNEINPYTSSIDLKLFNNNKFGTIKVTKNLD